MVGFIVKQTKAAFDELSNSGRAGKGQPI